MAILVLGFMIVIFTNIIILALTENSRMLVSLIANHLISIVICSCEFAAFNCWLIRLHVI